MKRTILTAAVLLIPAALFAEVHININAGVAVAQSTPDDESWFEGDQYNDNTEMSFEYNWTSDNGQRVLQYRQVSFFPIDGTWAFGPWMIRGGFCHSSCHMHHVHNYYHHSGNAPQWRREYSHCDRYNHPQYRYICREDHYAHRVPVQVTRHEYYPPVRHESHEYSPPVRRECNVQPERRYEHNAETPRIAEERHQVLEERKRIEQSRNNDNRDNNYEHKRDNRHDNNTIVRVTERERIR
jgi:hypothetical protein